MVSYPTDHRENILKTAKALVEDTKTLVAGAASSQEQLAVAAQNAVTTIVQLSEIVKSGAASLGSPNREAQVMLINSVKDVASALGDLMQSTKSASGKSIQDPAMHHLKDSAKVSQSAARQTSFGSVRAPTNNLSREIEMKALFAGLDSMVFGVRHHDHDNLEKMQQTITLCTYGSGRSLNGIAI